MARLIVINGPPGAGKSTIARRLADAHPLLLNLEIDGLRRMLGDWKADPFVAGARARELAVDLTRNHLAAGHDVVVPQYLGNADYLRTLEAVATEVGAAWYELVLLDTKDVMRDRFVARTEAGREQAHLDAQQILDRVGGLPQLEAMYDRLLLVIGSRETAQIVPAREGKIDETYDAVLSLLS